MSGPETPYSQDSRTPSLVDVINAATRGLSLELRVCMPVTVTEVRDGGAMVNVVPDIKSVLSTEDGEVEVESVEIPNIPVLTYGQGTPGGGYLQFPVQFGDKGLMVVNDRGIGNWYESGLEGAPDAYHTHNQIDGVFLPGLRYRGSALTQDSTAAVLEHSQIKLGSGATLGAARLNDSVRPGLTMGQWIGAVTAAFAGIGVTIPAPTDFGEISGSSSKVMIE